MVQMHREREGSPTRRRGLARDRPSPYVTGRGLSGGLSYASPWPREGQAFALRYRRGPVPRERKRGDALTGRRAL